MIWAVCRAVLAELGRSMDAAVSIDEAEGFKRSADVADTYEAADACDNVAGDFIGRHTHARCCGAR